ncbi:hypothetical protein EJ03DRAFT_381951 [Teratosphaeria nubilosa]|uniref:Uncharacterized protein n=1 Tax=Teratosphaeria nubilosa TaxID=161662 RepID=A0A6G1LE83_9PEZI|nr:hypothetical protein EJ03DRAFT_381951 [Teratosphaeria nubilosa]
MYMHSQNTLPTPPASTLLRSKIFRIKGRGGRLAVCCIWQAALCVALEIRLLSSAYLQYTIHDALSGPRLHCSRPSSYQARVYEDESQSLGRNYHDLSSLDAPDALAAPSAHPIHPHQHPLSPKSSPVLTPDIAWACGRPRQFADKRQIAGGRAAAFEGQAACMGVIDVGGL